MWNATDAFEVVLVCQELQFLYKKILTHWPPPTLKMQSKIKKKSTFLTSSAASTVPAASLITATSSTRIITYFINPVYKTRNYFTLLWETSVDERAAGGSVCSRCSWGLQVRTNLGEFQSLTNIIQRGRKNKVGEILCLPVGEEGGGVITKWLRDEWRHEAFDGGHFKLSENIYTAYDRAKVPSCGRQLRYSLCGYYLERKGRVSRLT